MKCKMTNLHYLIRGIGLLVLFLILSTLNRVNAQTIDGNKTAPLIFVEQMPVYPGGQEAMMKFLQENIIYPNDARKEKVTGKVILQFIVTDEGKITEIENMKAGVDKRLVDEAIRVVGLMPDWQPGSQDGKNVFVKFTLPIVFKL